MNEMSFCIIVRLINTIQNNIYLIFMANLNSYWLLFKCSFISAKNRFQAKIVKFNINTF